MATRTETPTWAFVTGTVASVTIGAAIAVLVWVIDVPLWINFVGLGIQIAIIVAMVVAVRRNGRIRQERARTSLHGYSGGA